ncbi:hypothetical protein [Eupransor demetentiae]|uniref:Phage protein n=1 Tax=Eupransor demetentiae TaxID=3109584 RepID=A0ABP0EPC3_9LACO|nr:hypothetical protein R54876_GBNLAHCA_00685 [Lactobacillaceae bacterium LMG 33000]
MKYRKSVDVEAYKVSKDDFLKNENVPDWIGNFNFSVDEKGNFRVDLMGMTGISTAGDGDYLVHSNDEVYAVAQGVFEKTYEKAD